MSRGARIKQFLKAGMEHPEPITGLEINCMPPVGDCFYKATEVAIENGRAFSHIILEEPPDVAYLRRVVARALNQRVFESYQIYNQSDIEGYEFMSKCDSLDQLRQMIQTCGNDKRKDCVWADLFAIQTIANHCRISFLIFNELKTITTTTIFPETSPPIPISKLRYVILHLTKRNHYNLIGWKQSGDIVQYLFSLTQLPDIIVGKFDLVAHAPKFLPIDLTYDFVPEPTPMIDLLPDSLLIWFFNKYFTENQRKYCLANVSLKWGKLIWNSCEIPCFTQVKRSGGSGRETKHQNSPNEYLAKLRVKIPRIGDYIENIHLDYFETQWMNLILSDLKRLKGFYFRYGTVLKHHLSNPELKVLLKKLPSQIRILSIAPNPQGFVPIRFNGCGFRAICRCTNLEVLHLGISSDQSNIILSKLKTKSLRELILYDSKNVTEEDLESFLERIENHQPELIFTINDADQIDLETRQKLICDFQQKSVRLSFCDLPFARLGNKRKLKS